MFFRVLVVGCLSLLTAANPVSDDHGIFEQLHSAPEEWKAVGSPPVEMLLGFKIALQAAEPTALVRHLQDVSSPSNERYGQHLSIQQLKEILSPSEEAKKSVHSWLKRSGVQNIDERGEWIHFTATTKQADAMMNTKFLTYRHVRDSNAEAIRTTKVGLPRSVIPHIKMIHPTTRFTQIHEQSSNIIRVKDDPQAVVRYANGDAGQSFAPSQTCNATITPTCLRELYNIKGVEIPDPSKVGTIGVAGFLRQYARFNDLALFTEAEAPWAKDANFTWTGINGGLLDQDYMGSSTEANLDIQYTIGLSHPMKNRYLSTGGKGPWVADLDQPSITNNQNEPYLEFFQYLLGEQDIPHTITISYGENEQSVPPSYAKTVCDLIAQLGTRGTSVIISSGDTGVGSACQTNDGKNTTRFLPVFPAACPYVTSIGGTVGINPERAVDFSSGGFSDLWERPWYQEQTIPKYLQTLGSQWEGLYNTKGRGFPDIAAQGVDFRIFDSGSSRRISGTSASAPVVAGMIGLLNAKRLQSGQPTLGFLNPWLYETGAKTMTDITEGGSSGCTGRDIYSGLKTPLVPGASWKAVPGWDAVTGLGTPKFDQMLASLPQGKSASYPTGPRTVRRPYIRGRPTV
jgi:tripeptidyl-peptidase-1